MLSILAWNGVEKNADSYCLEETVFCYNYYGYMTMILFISVGHYVLN